MDVVREKPVLIGTQKIYRYASRRVQLSRITTDKAKHDGVAAGGGIDTHCESMSICSAVDFINHRHSQTTIDSTSK